MSGITPIEKMTKARLKKLCRTLIPGFNPWRNAGTCGFDVDRALEAVRFFPGALRHCKGAMAGHPFLLTDWQAAAIGNLFGWYRPDGSRRFRKVLIYIPRKNGKTTLAAGIIIYVMFTDGEPGAEIYGAASEYKQASLVWEHVSGMIHANPALESACKLYTGQAKGVQLVSDRLSMYRVIACNATSAHGGNTHLGVIDELHALPNRELVDVLATSRGSRRQPLLVYLTTADFEREESICNEIHDQAKAVRDGLSNDPTFLPIIYEAERSDDWKSPKVWAKANPNLGISFYNEFLEEQKAEAERVPGFENTFKRLHLNIRTEQANRWLSLDEWDRGGEAFDASELLGKKCWSGLDLGYTSDLTALCLLFLWTGAPVGRGFAGHESYRALWWFWTPRSKALEWERKKEVPYTEWAQKGFVELTPDDETDYALIRTRIREIGQKYRIMDLAMDRTFQGVQLSHELSEEDGLNVVAFGQGFMSMSAPTAEFGRLVRRGELLHNCNPVLRWMCSGLAVKEDPAGNLKPDKAASGTKIDGIVAAIMALGRAMDSPRPKQPLYAARGPVFVGV